MKGLYKHIGIVGCSLMLFTPCLAQQGNGSLGGIPITTGQEGAPADWFFECTDPTSTTPISTPYETSWVGNELMLCTMGNGTGAWTAGGSKTFSCWGQGSEAMHPQGRFCFSYGVDNQDDVQLLNSHLKPIPNAIGSVQQYSPGFRDAALALNYGAPINPGYCYVGFAEDGATAPTYFGAQSAVLFYAGESNRYMTYVDTSVSNFTIDLQVELVADAVRFRWTCTNNTTAPHTLQMWFCSGVNMLTDQSPKYWSTTSTPLYASGNFSWPYFPPTSSGVPAYGIGPDGSGIPNDPSGSTGFDYLTNGGRVFRDQIQDTTDPSGYQGIFVYLPNQRPPTTDETLSLKTDPVDFPDYVDFDFSETDAFGMRIETKPSTSTNDSNPTNIPNKANEIVLGKAPLIISQPSTTGMNPLNLIPDTGFLDQPAFIVMYDPLTVPGSSTGQYLNYVRSTWGNASYSLPFGAVVDAPSVIQEGPKNNDGTPSGSFNPNGPVGGGLVSNATADAAGFQDAQLIRVWIDNVGGNVTNGYGVTGKEFTLDDVQVNLSFGAPGMSIVNSSGATQTIASIAPRADAYVDFYVRVAQNVVGQIPYTVTINTVPINHKVITGSIEVSGRPQFTLYPGANLVTAPYVFTDSSWPAILSDFVNPGTPGVGSGASANTYVWDPERQAYDQSLSASRGNGYWVVYNNPTKKPVFAQMEGGPSVPLGFDNSTQQIELKPGWNLIANPYDLEFAIAMIDGVSAANPNVVYTYSQLVNGRYISGYVANWDPVNQVYAYTSGLSGNLEPNTGYWINDQTDADITLSYPSLFTEATPMSSNKAPTPPLGAGIFRLNLTASEGAYSDIATAGNAASTTEQVTQTIDKAPAGPTQRLLMGFYGTESSGRTAFLRQALAMKASSYQWSGYVSDLVPGSVTLKWPNVSTVPSGLGVFLVDSEGGKTIDMRQFTSYSYAQMSPGIRHFKVLVEPVTMSKSLITSLTASTQKVGTATDEKFTYTLSSAATTTVDVRNPSTLSLIAEVVVNRADPSGTSIALWDLKDQLGRVVPAGNYVVWVKSITSTGTEQIAQANFSVP